MRVHEQDARWFKFVNLVWLFFISFFTSKISEIHLNFGSILILVG
jgi:hypothetical protein